MEGGFRQRTIPSGRLVNQLWATLRSDAEWPIGQELRSGWRQCEPTNETYSVELPVEVLDLRSHPAQEVGAPIGVVADIPMAGRTTQTAKLVLVSSTSLIVDRSDPGELGGAGAPLVIELAPIALIAIP